MDNVAPERFEFLIKINLDYFLSGIDGKVISGTAVPSAAFHADYRAADRICAGLRVHGYPQAFVADVTGKPVTADMLRGEAPPPAIAALPVSLSDVRRIRSSEFKKRYLNDVAFRTRVQEIEAQG